MRFRTLLAQALALLLVLGAATAEARGKRRAPKKPPKKNPFPSVTKLIPKEAFGEALRKLADDERVPVASSTLVEKGRGEGYYSVEKLTDNDPETFWAEGAQGWGKHEWVAFNLPEGTTHVEITSGAGKEQFQNFNRPRRLLVDVYLVRLERDKQTEKYEPTFRWMGRKPFRFKNKPQTVRHKLGLKLPELAMAERTMYVGVMIIDRVYKGQFDDTSIAELRTTSVWGSE